MAFIRSISGLRATLGDGLLPQMICDYTAAFSAVCEPGPIVVGRDGRPSGVWVEKLIAGTLSACGRKTNMVGVVPTPTVQLMVEHSEAAGGIAITASHNPWEWNGMKFINSSGVFLDMDENKELWEMVDEGDFNFSNEYDKVYINEIKDAVDWHIDRIFKIPALSNKKILERIKERKFSVVVDAVNASGSVAIPSLLAKLGCKVHPLYCDSSGLFPHTPEPIPANLGELAKEVVELKADFGIAVDPDADRLVLIDETGNPIGEEKTITLAVEAVLGFQKKKPERNCVVVNYSTSRMVDDVAKKYEAEVYRSPVGEINVVKLMKKTGAIIGGEGSGGVIYPQCHYGRDSLVGTALVLSLLASKKNSLSQLSKSLPHYEMIKLKKEFKGSIAKLIDIIAKKYKSGKVTRDDGIKVDFHNSWVQLRSSNTEPIIRVIAEAPTLQEAEVLAGDVLGLA